MFDAERFGKNVFAFSKNVPKSGTGIWAVDYGSPSTSIDDHSTKVLAIPQEVLEQCQGICETRWTGWAFEQTTLQPMLLFSDPADAMLAELLYSAQKD